VPEGPPWSADRLAAARALAQDRVSAEVLGALAGAGVPAILLKGPVLARWLYGDGATRTYGDTDVLVPDGRRADAEAVLRAQGFAPRLRPEDLAPGRTLHAHPWGRAADGAQVDLHVTLAGIALPPAAAFDALARETEPAVVAGAPVTVLAAPARALHVALHAAHDGAQGGKPLRDLDRALDQLDPATWRAARELAERLEAVEALASGLRLRPAGERLAATLGLPVARSVAGALLAASAPREALTVEHLAATRGTGARLRIVADRLAPSPSYLRFRSPLARRGRAGLALAYLWRPVSVLVRAPAAVGAWRRARAQSRDARPLG
jgi:hypothetical protein